MLLGTDADNYPVRYRHRLANRDPSRRDGICKERTRPVYSIRAKQGQNTSSRGLSFRLQKAYGYSGEAVDMSQKLSRRGVLRLGGSIFALSVSGCAAFAEENREQSGDDVSIPIFVYNEDDTSHEIFVQVDGTTDEETFARTKTVPSETVAKAGEVGASEFYLTARVENVENGMDATGPAPDESDYSADGYVIVVHDESDGQSRVEIEPLNPGGDATARSE